jgi:hypothetical protein
VELRRQRVPPRERHPELLALGASHHQERAIGRALAGARGAAREVVGLEWRRLGIGQRGEAVRRQVQHVGFL